jgi:peptidyl-tRNA hydrolase, PTH1 family
MLNAMKLIVGLGNPGEEYKHTRHNIGAKVVKILADSKGISLRRRRYFSHFGEGKIRDEDVIVILPLTYMNLSGEAVSAVVKDKEILLSDLLIVCDDADLNLGDIRVRPSGSDGGHRGLRSIIAKLETNSFARLRIGIGSVERGKKGSLKDYVLRTFEKSEMSALKKVEERAEEAIGYLLKNGVEKAMNKYNAVLPR